MEIHLMEILVRAMEHLLAILKFVIDILLYSAAAGGLILLLFCAAVGVSFLMGGDDED